MLFKSAASSCGSPGVSADQHCFCARVSSSSINPGSVVLTQRLASHSGTSCSARSQGQRRATKCAAGLAQYNMQDEVESLSGLAAPRIVQWYPGHIAKAERQLREQLGMVDLILEVIDARIPRSSRHPSLARWTHGKPCVLVVNRADMVSERDRSRWQAHLAESNQNVVWTNGVSGTGVGQLIKVAAHLGEGLNAARANRGLKARAVRACVVGFPNVGKSALINRLLGRRLAESAAKPGVTRSLRWMRVGGSLDLLDAPGIIPPAFDNQQAAQHLAMCNDIGEAAYVDSLVASALVEHLQRQQHSSNRSPLAILQKRYSWNTASHPSGEDCVRHIAESLFQGDLEKAGQRLLKDFRTGVLGRIALEHPAD